MSIVDILPKLNGFHASGAADENAIMSSEEQLGVKFSTEYRDYLLAYGSASFYGHILTGISPFPGCDVVRITQEERMLNQQVFSNLYVIEQAHIDGIVVWQDDNGAIYQTAPGTVPVKLCESLAEYIQR